MLSTDELRELDIRIDEKIPTLELLRANRRLALGTLLTEFDAIAQSYGEQPNLAQRSLNYRGSYNSFDHAVAWIFAYSPETSLFVPSNLSVSAQELLYNARVYSLIYAQMSLAFRGRNVITRVAQNRFRITSACEENLQLETARSLTAAGAYPESAEDTLDFPPHVADEVMREIRIEGISARQLRYVISDETYERARTIMEGRRLYRWSMDANWNLGEYTFDNLRLVWGALKTLQSLHHLALQKLPRQSDRRRLNVRIQTEEEWVSEIAYRCGLDERVVGKVFTDLIYNPSLFETGRKRSHVIYQPFFRMAPNAIAQSNSLILMSGVEKCAWILTELLRPSIHDRLKSLKERYWIENEFKTYEGDGIQVFPQINFTLDGKSRDIDVLILDTIEDFALVAQLKWTTSSDNPAGVESDDRQYANGVAQAERAMRWINNNRVDLARRLKMPKDQLRSTEFRPIVIAKETLPSGTFPMGGVPVINETLFRWIFRDPHNATLRQLWEVARNSSYLPKDGIHFTRHQPEPLIWNGLEFILDDVAYVPLERRWNPSTDIIIP